MKSYPTLAQFFGAYMHEDWRDDYADEWSALDDFMHSEPGGAVNFCAEMAELLGTDPSEDQLRRVLLVEFYAAAMVENRGWKYRDWLQALSDYAAKAIGHPQAS